MIPSLVFFILSHEDDFNTQKRENRLLSDDLEERLGTHGKFGDEKKASDNEIEIVEMSQTAKLSRKTSESPELTDAMAPNYWESLKIVMTSKVGSFYLIFFVFFGLFLLFFYFSKKGLHLFDAFHIILVLHCYRNAILGH